jgi:hypothetical protein
MFVNFVVHLLSESKFQAKASYDCCKRSFWPRYIN